MDASTDRTSTDRTSPADCTPTAQSWLGDAVPTIRWGHPEQSADLLDALGATITEDADLDLALRTLVSLAAKAIDGAARCGVTVVVADRTFAAVHSDARTLIVDAEQYPADDGPCLHAARTGEIVRIDAIAAETRWPDFVDSARRENVQSFLAAPLYSSSIRFGALNLYGEAPSAFDDADVETAIALTGALAHALGDYNRFDRLRTENTGLRFALAHRAPIEQAKGMLMAVHRIGPNAAFAMLADLSQSENRKVRDLAVDLVAQHSAPHSDTNTST